jgi:hypothetical protein
MNSGPTQAKVSISNNHDALAQQEGHELRGAQPVPHRYTPLVKCEFNGSEFFVKDEAHNPFSSIKDRKINYILNSLQENGFPDWIVCFTSFNVGASLRMHRQFIPDTTKVGIVTDIQYEGHRDWFESQGIEVRFLDLSLPVNESAGRFFRNQFGFPLHTSYYDVSDGVGISQALGYKSLAYEIPRQLKEERKLNDKQLRELINNKVVIFVPFGSGDIFVGMNRGFEEQGFTPRYSVVTVPDNPLGGLAEHPRRWNRSEFAPGASTPFTALKDEALRIIEAGKGRHQVQTLIGAHRGVDKLQTYIKKFEIEPTSALGFLGLDLILRRNDHPELLDVYPTFLLQPDDLPIVINSGCGKTLPEKFPV